MDVMRAKQTRAPMVDTRTRSGDDGLFRRIRLLENGLAPDHNKRLWSRCVEVHHFIWVGCPADSTGARLQPVARLRSLTVPSRSHAAYGPFEFFTGTRQPEWQRHVDRCLDFPRGSQTTA